MKPITNQKVYNALTHCIEKRWKLHAGEPSGYSYDAAPCALCAVFKTNSPPGTNYCENCPVNLRNGGKRCSTGSTYAKWGSCMDDYKRQEKAQAMLDELIAIKEYYFGDWK